MIRAILFTCLAVCPLLAGQADEVSRGVREAGLDPFACWRVRDLQFSAGRAKFFFTDGYLILGRQVNGSRVMALFSADVEGGEGEILLLPPNRAERQSLASYTGSPNLNEHFRTVLMMFSPEVLAAFTGQIRESPSSKPAPEMGALLESQFSNTARSLGGSFNVRLTWSLLDPESNRGFFVALVAGKTLGNFDVAYDPLVFEQVTAGALSYRDDRILFDTWTSFPDRNAPTPPSLTASNYRIEARIKPDRSMDVVTHYRLRVDRAARVVPVELADAMAITGARIDGESAELLGHEDLRAGLLRHSASRIALLVANHPLAAERDHEIEIHHQGNVIADAGNQVYYVTARSNWYPGWKSAYATYDLTFRIPKNLTIVLPGETVSESVEGDERVVRHRIDTPVNAAGFNLGVFDRVSVNRAGFQVDVYANREFEKALEPRPVIVRSPGQPPVPGRRPAGIPPVVEIAPVPSNPANKLQPLAANIADAMEFFSGLFGPPPLRKLAVTPLPAGFGQGFPGLIYLSTMSYAPPALDAQNDAIRLFFEELLEPHEAAHQWWGNLVYQAGYHDEWILESLANYSALLWLEKQHGSRKVVDAVLANYRDHLLKGDVDSVGPIVQGRRLESLQTPQAWAAITYGKGSWILHMLRGRMGDAAFLKMLAELRRGFDRKQISVEEFRAHCAKFLPTGSDDPKLEAFFEEWVYGTGIPQLKLTWHANGRSVTGRLTQSGVRKDFAIDVPVEIRAGGTVIRKMLRTDSEGAEFEYAVGGTVTRVALDPDGVILRRP